MHKLNEVKKSRVMRQLLRPKLSRRFQYLPGSKKTKWMVVDSLDVIYAIGEAPSKRDAIKCADDFLMQHAAANDNVHPK